MGTNFYLMTKSKKIAQTYFDGEYEIVDEPYFGYQIHIGKRSFGWKPLFQRHDSAYDSVVGLKKFIIGHTDEELEIYDEYGRKYTLDELDEDLIQWADKQEVGYYKYVPEGVYNKIFGDKDYLVLSDKDDFNIKTPFDHIEYDILYKRMHPYYVTKSYCTHDKDGYDFMEGDFC